MFLVRLVVKQLKFEPEIIVIDVQNNRKDKKESKNDKKQSHAFSAIILVAVIWHF